MTSARKDTIATLSVGGVDEIQRVLTTLAVKEARNLARSTVNGMAGETRKKARQFARDSKRTGALIKAIKSKRVRAHPDAPKAVVYIEHGNEAKHDAFYWAFMEWGTKPSKDDVNSHKHNFSTEGDPFIRPAQAWLKRNRNTLIRELFGKRYEKFLAKKAKQ